MKTKSDAQSTQIERPIGESSKDADFNSTQQGLGRAETHRELHDAIVRDIGCHRLSPMPTRA
jgi:hypothetical protein